MSAVVRGPRPRRRAVPGEHRADFGYVPATGHQGAGQHTGEGYAFPAVGVALVQSEPDRDDTPLVVLHLDGPFTDSDVHLRPAEADEVMLRIQTALQQLG